MAIYMLETTTTIKMSLAEATALSRLLGMLPGAKPAHGQSVAIDSTRIGNGEWERLINLYESLSTHLDAVETERARWAEVEGYLIAAADGSMSRNNSQNLAAELLEQVRSNKA